MLTDLHKDYPQWLKKDQQRRVEEATKRKSAPKKEASDWMSIFDAGDEAIQQSNK